MHHVQRKILEKLLYAESLPFASMRPAGIETNLYTYHLSQLIKAGLVEKHDKRYSLTAQGMSVVDRMSQAAMTPRIQPHIVTAIDVTNEQGLTVLFKRNFHPYIYHYSFPLGKTHYEETVHLAAERELAEKTGLTGLPLTQRGIVYIEARRSGAVVTKLLCHVFQATVKGSPAVTCDNAQRGTAAWLDHTRLHPTETMPGLLATKRLLAEHPAFFFAEFSEEF